MEAFFAEVWSAVRAGHGVWTALAWLIVAALATGHGPSVRRRLTAPAIMLVVAGVALLIGAAASASGYVARPWMTAALAFELLAGIGIAQVAVFTIGLPKVGVVVPRILVDI